MKYKSITVINDCASANDKGRQMVRYASLFGITPEFIGLYNYSEIEAAGELIDALDAQAGIPGIIAVNSAPRHGHGKKWSNGTPFGYLYIGETLVVTTIDGFTLSLTKKLGLADSVMVTDIEEVLNSSEISEEFDDEEKQRIINTQFRSFEYLPRLAKWLAEGKQVPAKEYSFSNVPDLGRQIWYVDGFGNCKTTILPEEVGFEVGRTVATKIGNIVCQERLKDVLDNETALVVGSSGFGKQRFVELIVQGKRANEVYDLEIGSVLV